MRATIRRILIAVVAAVVASNAAAERFEYPKARKSDQVDEIAGTRVADPYRWLENADDPEVVAWVEAQNVVTRTYLDRLASRAALVRRLTELTDYPRYGIPERKGEWLFFSKNDGLQNQSVLYKQRGSDSKPTVLLDPNTLSSDGTISLGAKGTTRDGALMAYGLHESGSDWQTLRVRDVAAGRDLSDRLERVRFTSVSWKADKSGFYYSRYAAGEEHFQKLYFHRVGDDQAADVLVYERPENKDLGVDGQVTHDGRFLVINVWNGTAPENETFVQRLGTPPGTIDPLFTGFQDRFDFTESQGDRLFFITDRDAPRARVVAVDVGDPARTLHEIVPQQEDVLESAKLTNGRLALTYMHNAYSTLKVYTLAGKLEHDVETPTLGSIHFLSGDPKSDELFVNFSSFLFPAQNYRYDFGKGRMDLLQRSECAFNPDGYTARQVFYESKDGTKVPMFLVHPRGIKLDADNPVLLYGYGGFNVSQTPRFSTSWVLWLEQGGVVAMPSLRGGGEFGEDWHKAGMLDHKQNVFDDFIAAAEWLVAQGYTTPERIAIEGGSNGGLLTAVCALQRPDLYGAVLTRVPVIDMMRYHKFTIGSYWVPEYGNPEDPEHFRFLYAYSPLHNVKPGVQVPAMFITSADTDTRVDPCHAKKFAATLQAAASSTAPILLRVETKAGHGAGKPTTKTIEERADLFAFVMDRLGMEYTQPAAGVVEETSR